MKTEALIVGLGAVLFLAASYPFLPEPLQDTALTWLRWLGEFIGGLLEAGETGEAT